MAFPAIAGVDRIREVWAANLVTEFKEICCVVQSFPFVAMDTEFPGTVARPIGDFKSTAEYQYQMLRCNVDLLKIIQIGLTFFDAEGRMPEGVCTWQFNFKFDLSQDMYAEDSVELLQNSGIQFARHERDGIMTADFAEMLLVSGAVLLDTVTWLSFHSSNDFGYLLRLLTNVNLPEEETEFFETLNIYFPRIYDVKFLMTSCHQLRGGLQEVADALAVERIGPQHQAGSDSLLTGRTFFAMVKQYFEDKVNGAMYLGQLFGLGPNPKVGDCKVFLAVPGGDATITMNDIKLPIPMAVTKVPTGDDAKVPVGDNLSAGETS